MTVSNEVIRRVRALYTTGHGPEHIKTSFNLDDATFAAILRGEYGHGSYSK